jgi:hypothetical protein
MLTAHYMEILPLSWDVTPVAVTGDKRTQPGGWRSSCNAFDTKAEQIYGIATTHAAGLMCTVV